MNWQLFLDKTKYGGLRFIYYRLTAKFPGLEARLRDVFTPNLTSRYLSEQLIRIYDGTQGHGADLRRKDFLGLGLIHYSLIRMNRPKRVLCVGSLKGYIPAVCALACQENQLGRVDFVDPGFGEETSDSWGGVGFWRQPKAEEQFKRLRLDRIKLYLMTNQQFVQTYPRRTYDYIYIDGDHSYQGAKLDYQLFWSRLRPYGFMTYHDILGTGKIDGAEFGVKRFWNELKHVRRIELRHPKQSGLGIMQKTE